MASANDFYYSTKYEDEEYEYRHVHVTKEVAKLVPRNRLMSESEWRSLGIHVAKSKLNELQQKLAGVIH